MSNAGTEVVRPALVIIRADRNQQQIDDSGARRNGPVSQHTWDRVQESIMAAISTSGGVLRFQGSGSDPLLSEHFAALAEAWVALCDMPVEHVAGFEDLLRTIAVDCGLRHIWCVPVEQHAGIVVRPF